jgi:hypothetical protein
MAKCGRLQLALLLKRGLILAMSLKCRYETVIDNRFDIKSLIVRAAVAPFANCTLVLQLFYV